jgi:glycosyltransferase involved in cell wall biosynthesis
MNPLVSIITPAFNAEPYIAETLRSVLSQTHSRFEVLVVNDGSRDGTLAAARSFTDPRIKVIDQQNRGASAARNRGLKEAQGEFVQYLDADDLLAPNKIEIQLRRLLSHPNATATGRWGRFSSTPEKAFFVPESFWIDMEPVNWLVERWERASMVHPAGWLMPRSVIDRAGGWDESLTLDDDGEYFGRIVLSSERILFCDEAVSFYRSGLPTSLSGSKSPVAWKSALRSIDLGADRLIAFENSPRTRRACSRAYEEFVYACYPEVSEQRDRAWKRVRELGGPYFRPQMGPKMKAVSRIVGWKLAKRLQVTVGQLLGRRA